ncbi:ornithine cyclodeaminase family protein, partial [Methylocaldum sp.]|uniref:ornithine cyclodeaminase family protein n=1 Tax=Methylocaldum sp. TaxID=1969727 RepID=UPI002D75B9A1
AFHGRARLGRQFHCVFLGSHDRLLASRQSSDPRHDQTLHCYRGEALAGLRTPIHPTTDLEQAVRDADIVSCATMTTAPLIRGEWLKPGTHLDLVGAFTPEMREADDTAIRRAKIFVDSRETTIAHIGELCIPIREGVISEADILADHFELCRGMHPGRQSPAEITLFKNGGGGHLDLMTAHFILDRAGHKSRENP